MSTLMTPKAVTPKATRQPARQEPTVPAFDAQFLRGDFPILERTIDGCPLVYLDNAATTQKPQAVLDVLQSYYEQSNANVHRGVHHLSSEATRLFEQARNKVARFLHAASSREIIFTRGTTEAINLVAQSYGRARLQAGDEILISWMEHHSNIVPWQMVCQQTGAVLKVVPINDQGELILEEYQRLLSPRTKIVAVTHVSNALGTINPIEEMIALAHRQDTPVLVDGAQSVPHMPVNVRQLGCDFFAFSGHKAYGPTGIGVLYGKQELLEAMPPYQGGGDMISSVTFAQTTYNELPFKFEAGTPDIAGAIGLGAAIDYLQRVGLDNIAAHEADLLEYGHQALASVPGLTFIGTARRKAGVISFVLDGIHPHDIATILDGQGIAVRAGHHCAQPVMDRFDVAATSRASFALYNTRAEIDALVQGLIQVREVFGG